jgi:hypothetical protein
MRRLLAATALSAAALFATAAFAASSVVGTWSVATETPNGKREGTLTVAQTGSAYSVTYVATAPAGGAAGGPGAGGPPPQSTISDVAVNGNTLTFKRSFSGGPNGPIDIAYTLTADGNAISGTSKSSFGEAKVTGTRK